MNYNDYTHFIGYDYPGNRRDKTDIVSICNRYLEATQIPSAALNL